MSCSCDAQLCSGFAWVEQGRSQRSKFGDSKRSALKAKLDEAATRYFDRCAEGQASKLEKAELAACKALASNRMRREPSTRTQNPLI